MPILTHHSQIIDDDLERLRQHLAYLDGALAPAVLMAKAQGQRAENSSFQDIFAQNSTPFAEIEYIIGHGLVAAQHYLSATRCTFALTYEEAFGLAPFLPDGPTFAKALYEGANHWQYAPQWALGLHEDEALRQRAQSTLSAVKRPTLWADYPCANLLFALTAQPLLRLSNLLPPLKLWRDQLLKLEAQALRPPQPSPRRTWLSRRP